jgi:flagellar basal-body rod modification protein FlgD
MSTSPVTPPATGGSTSSTSGLPSGQSLNNMFLQLLVAQLQNQDPTDPVDPSQFVGQLAQFSELSEVTSIYTLLQSFVPTTTGSGSGSTGSTGSADPANGNATPTVGALAAAGLSAIVPAAAASTPATIPNFSSPAISALTGNIQGVY